MDAEFEASLRERTNELEERDKRISSLENMLRSLDKNVKSASQQHQIRTSPPSLGMSSSSHASSSLRAQQTSGRESEQPMPHIRANIARDQATARGTSLDRLSRSSNGSPERGSGTVNTTRSHNNHASPFNSNDILVSSRHTDQKLGNDGRGRIHNGNDPSIGNLEAQMREVFASAAAPVFGGSARLSYNGALHGTPDGGSVSTSSMGQPDVSIPTLGRTSHLQTSQQISALQNHIQLQDDAIERRDAEREHLLKLMETCYERLDRTKEQLHEATTHAAESQQRLVEKEEELQRTLGMLQDGINGLNEERERLAGVEADLRQQQELLQLQQQGTPHKNDLMESRKLLHRIGSFGVTALSQGDVYVRASDANIGHELASLLQECLDAGALDRETASHIDLPMIKSTTKTETIPKKGMAPPSVAPPTFISSQRAASVIFSVFPAPLDSPINDSTNDEAHEAQLVSWPLDNITQSSSRSCIPVASTLSNTIKTSIPIVNTTSASVASVPFGKLQGSNASKMPRGTIQSNIEPMSIAVRNIQDSNAQYLPYPSTPDIAIATSATIASVSSATSLVSRHSPTIDVVRPVAHNSQNPSTSLALPASTTLSTSATGVSWTSAGAVGSSSSSHGADRFLSFIQDQSANQSSLDSIEVIRNNMTAANVDKDVPSATEWFGVRSYRSQDSLQPALSSIFSTQVQPVTTTRSEWA